MTQAEAFNAKEKVHHGSPEFMKNLNSPAFMKTKMIIRKYHEAVVVQKEKELRALGYRTFNTSNYANHYRVPDIIAISPDGKVTAVEMESIRRYKSSVESLRRRYTTLLMKENFFDNVVVEGFIPPNFAQDSNRQKTELNNTPSE